jgi:hypothetical protein
VNPHRSRTADGVDIEIWLRRSELEKVTESSGIRLERTVNMAKDTGTTRAPRGTKPVVAAFFSALNEVPEPQRAAVTKAAVASIRSEIKANHGKRAKASPKAKVPARIVRKAAASEKKAAPVKKASPAKKAARQTIAKAPSMRATPKPAMKKAAPAKRKTPQEKSTAKTLVSDKSREHSDFDIKPPENSVEC